MPVRSAPLRWILPTLIAGSAALLLLAAMHWGAPAPAPRRVTGERTVRLQRHLVELRIAPLARYRGELPGLAAPERDARGKLDLGAPAARAYLARLERELDAFAAALHDQIPGSRIDWRYRLVLAGATVAVPPGALPRLRALPGVRRVWSTDRVLHRRTLDASLDLIGAPTYWDSTGAGQAGLGMRIAVIDSGIDIDNPLFDPSGLDYPAGFPRGATAHTSPKVIAARAYFRPDDPVNVARDEPNPRDHMGHGSHCAGIIAGSPGTVFDLGGYAPAVSGVAPRAQLTSYKVFYRAESGLDGARDPELVAAFEDAVADGADVISNSWGGPDVYGEADPTRVAYEAAIEAGAVVVFASGNEGPGDGSVGSPGAHGRFVTVGSVSTGRTLGQHLDVTAPEPVPEPLTQVRMSVGYISPPIDTDVGPAPLVPTSTLDDGSHAEACETLPASSLEGVVALVRRGSCTFSLKALNVAAAGALALVVANQTAGEASFPMGGEPVPLPAVMVSLVDGEALEAHALAHPDARVALRAGVAPFFEPTDDDVVVRSSSRGPTACGRVKPDLVAPGQLILSANAYAVGETGPAWGFKAGTSMATPHVSGAAALLLRAHPSWDHDGIKAALVGTARRDGLGSWLDDEAPAAAWEVGGGRLALDRALHVRLLAYPATLDFGWLAPGESRTATVRLRRTSAAVTAVTWRQAVGLGGGGVAVSPADGEVLLLPAGDGVEVPVTVTLDATTVLGDRAGTIVLEDDAGGTTGLPVALRIAPKEPDRDLLVVDLSFSEDSSPIRDVAGLALEVARTLGLSVDRAPITDRFRAPTPGELSRYRAVLVVTGTDRSGHLGNAARRTLDRISGYLLGGGSLVLMGEGPLRDTRHDRFQALSGAATLGYPLRDPSTGGLAAQPEYRVQAWGDPLLVSGPVDLTPTLDGSPILALVGELATMMGSGVEPWSRGVLRLTEGSFSGGGIVGLVYDPFAWYGVDALAEAHRHRAVVLGFGLETVSDPAGGPVAPGSRAELLHRTLGWVSDRVSLDVTVALDATEITLDASALARTSPVASYRFELGDGSEPVESATPRLRHAYPAYGAYEITVIARSESGAAAVWRREVPVQPASGGPDAGVPGPDAGAPRPDAGPADAGAPPDVGGGGGCDCAASPGNGAIVSWLVGLLPGLLIARRARRRRRTG
jgi:subtilisin family serine protease